MKPRIEFAAATHTGLRRENNQDFWLIEEKAGLFAVADGMGGHEAGGLAARIAIDATRQFVLGAARETSASSPDAILRGAVQAAHRSITAESKRLRQERPMGTTLVAALLTGDQAVVASVGDSRAYLIRARSHQRLTRDHRVVEEYADLGIIPRRDVASHPLRNMLSRSLGGPRDVEPDLTRLTLAPGDRLLLCSDGLSEMLDDLELVRRVREGKAPERAAELLIEGALGGGGLDNVTVVIVARPRSGAPRPRGAQRGDPEATVTAGPRTLHRALAPAV